MKLKAPQGEYNMKLIKLNEALEGILNSITDMLEEANGKGHGLGVEATIVRGDRARPQPDLPAVWFHGMPATPDHSQRTMAEKWTLPIAIVALVQNTEPEEGYSQATELAARARSVLIRDRTLRQREYVQDVKSGRFEMSGPDTQREDIFAASAIIEVVFVILENNP